MKSLSGLYRIGPVLLLVCLVGFALAQEQPAATDTPDPGYPPDVEKLLKNMEPKLYSPWREGIKDLSFQIHMPMMEMMGMGDARLIYQWKSPDKSRFSIEGDLPQPEMKGMLQGQMEGQAKSFADLMLMKPHLEKFKGHDVVLTRDGELHKLHVIAKKSDAGFTTQTVWVNAEYIPVKVEIKRDNPMMGGEVTETSTFTYEDKGGQKLFSNISAKTSMGDQKVAFQYVDVGKYRLISKMTIESPMNPMGPIEIEFRDLKVDQNLDDSIFEKK